MTKMWSIASVLAALCAGVAAQEVNFQPAIYRAGSLPTLPVTAVGGGEVLLDAAVSAGGAVTAVTPLRVTPPFTEPFADAVLGWLFRPARDLDQAAPSHVLVAVLVRPPALTVPSTFGEPARDVSVPRADLPMPITLITPAQPPRALRSGVVLLEVRVDSGGRVSNVHVVRSAPPYDGAAQEAAWQCTFRAARLRGIPVASMAYLAFGFPEIVTGT
jgi:TonB family protein